MELIIISGTTGKLGEEYLNYLQKETTSDLISITRRAPKKTYKDIKYIFLDLLDKKTLLDEIKKLNFNKYSQVILIHPIGMFKFEHSKRPETDSDNDGIDDEVYVSNINTFTNLFSLLKNQIKKCESPPELTVCGFGSISDRYNIPYWISYTKSKNYLRKLIQRAVKKNKIVKIRGVFVNVSTVDTGNERGLRPYGDRTYWLSPSEIVNSSIGIILNGKRKYTEINIYKENPDFKPYWYTNHENILERWNKQMKR